MNLQRIPIAAELFAQWRRARGGGSGIEWQRPFYRKWNDLLEDAGIVSAQDQNDADRDARALQQLGLLELKTVRYKAHLIERAIIPLAREDQWMEAFGFIPPDNEELRQIQNFPWEPPLQFLKTARLNLSLAELQQLNQFFANNNQSMGRVPIKERSLAIFGDEKRLDLLYASSSLFADDRLNLDHLRCFIVPEPLGWRRGKNPSGPIIILENVATWHTYCQWDVTKPQFSAIVYGGGKRIIHSVESLKIIFEELGGPRPIFYFGDLDAAGLQIPRIASARAQSLSLAEPSPTPNLSHCTPEPPTASASLPHRMEEARGETTPNLTSRIDPRNRRLPPAPSPIGWERAGVRVPVHGEGPLVPSASPLPGEISPHLWSYAQLFKLASLQPITQPTEKQIWTPDDTAWLRDLAPAAETLLRSNQRIAQEWLTLERLTTAPE